MCRIKRSVILLSFLLILSLAGCKPFFHPAMQEFSKKEIHMGTVVSISVIAEDKASAEHAIDEAFGEINRIEKILSEYDNRSEVSILNRQGKIHTDEEELIFLIRQSLLYSNRSRGAFDITVKPVLDLYSESFSKTGEPPNSLQVELARRKIGSKDIRVEGKNISFMKEGMKITLGGIAKGYAVDVAGAVLEEQGIKSYLINAGGDLLAKGMKPDGSRWVIALQNPRDPDDLITRFQISDDAVTTSGDYERYFDENRSYHHIIDPRTGYSAKGLISATIIAPNALSADALSTSVFVLGEKDGLDLVESLDGAECLLITADRRIIRSEGFPG